MCKKRFSMLFQEISRAKLYFLSRSQKLDRQFSFLPIFRFICKKRRVTQTAILLEDRRTNLTWVLIEAYLGNPLVCDCEMRWYKKWFNAEWQVTRVRIYLVARIFCAIFILSTAWILGIIYGTPRTSSSWIKFSYVKWNKYLYLFKTYDYIDNNSESWQTCPLFKVDIYTCTSYSD